MEPRIRYCGLHPLSPVLEDLEEMRSDLQDMVLVMAQELAC